MTYRLATPLLLLLATGACVQTNVAQLEPGVSHAPTCVDAVLIYDTSADAPAGYRQVAIIQSSADAVMVSDGRMKHALRERAASVGATGIIMHGTTSPSAASTVLRSAAGWPAERDGLALAIQVPADSARVAAACAAK